MPIRKIIKTRTNDLSPRSRREGEVGAPESVPAMGCICCCPERQGYENLDRTSQVEDATLPNPTAYVQRQPEEFSGRAETSSSQEPAVEYRPPPSTPIQESMDQAPSDIVTIDREGCIRKGSGYALRIPPGSFPYKVDARVTISLPDSVAHPVPKGSEVVSGICHIDSVEVELKKRGSLVIDHCINIRSAEDRDSVGVVTRYGRRERNASNGSDQFQYVDDSDVDVRSDCAVVRLRKLEPASYAVVCAKDRREAVAYCGLLYRLQLEADLVSPLKFIFSVVKYLKCYIKVL